MDGQQPKLEEFMQNLAACQPVIPDPVAMHLMHKNGLNTDDPRIVRLISLATQKFISDITLDAMQLVSIFLF
jgi:transcription initiation factor TFIID subunit 10